MWKAGSRFPTLIAHMTLIFLLDQLECLFLPHSDSLSLAHSLFLSSFCHNLSLYYCTQIAKWQESCFGLFHSRSSLCVLFSFNYCNCGCFVAAAGALIGLFGLIMIIGFYGSLICAAMMYLKKKIKTWPRIRPLPGKAKLATGLGVEHFVRTVVAVVDPVLLLLLPLSASWSVSQAGQQLDSAGRHSGTGSAVLIMQWAQLKTTNSALSTVSCEKSTKHTIETTILYTLYRANGTQSSGANSSSYNEWSQSLPQPNECSSCICPTASRGQCVHWDFNYS